MKRKQNTRSRKESKDHGSPKRASPRTKRTSMNPPPSPAATVLTKRALLKEKYTSPRLKKSSSSIVEAGDADQSSSIISMNSTFDQNDTLDTTTFKQNLNRPGWYNALSESMQTIPVADLTGNKPNDSIFEVSLASPQVKSPARKSKRGARKVSMGVFKMAADLRSLDSPTKASRGASTSSNCEENSGRSSRSSESSEKTTSEDVDQSSSLTTDRTRTRNARRVSSSKFAREMAQVRHTDSPLTKSKQSLNTTPESDQKNQSEYIDSPILLETSQKKRRATKRVSARIFHNAVGQIKISESPKKNKKSTSSPISEENTSDSESPTIQNASEKRRQSKKKISFTAAIQDMEGHSPEKASPTKIQTVAEDSNDSTESVSPIISSPVLKSKRHVKKLSIGVFKHVMGPARESDSPIPRKSLHAVHKDKDDSDCASPILEEQFSGRKRQVKKVSLSTFDSEIGPVSSCDSPTTIPEEREFELESPISIETAPLKKNRFKDVGNSFNQAMSLIHSIDSPISEAQISDTDILESDETEPESPIPSKPGLQNKSRVSKSTVAFDQTMSLICDTDSPTSKAQNSDADILENDQSEPDSPIAPQSVPQKRSRRVPRDSLSAFATMGPVRHSHAAPIITQNSEDDESEPESPVPSEKSLITRDSFKAFSRFGPVRRSESLSPGSSYSSKNVKSKTVTVTENDSLIGKKSYGPVKNSTWSESNPILEADKIHIDSPITSERTFTKNLTSTNITEILGDLESLNTLHHLSRQGEEEVTSNTNDESPQVETRSKNKTRKTADIIAPVLNISSLTQSQKSASDSNMDIEEEDSNEEMTSPETTRARRRPQTRGSIGKFVNAMASLNSSQSMTIDTSIIQHSPSNNIAITPSKMKESESQPNVARQSPRHLKVQVGSPPAPSPAVHVMEPSGQSSRDKLSLSTVMSESMNASLALNSSNSNISKVSLSKKSQSSIESIQNTENIESPFKDSLSVNVSHSKKNINSQVISPVVIDLDSNSPLPEEMPETETQNIASANLEPTEVSVSDSSSDAILSADTGTFSKKKRIKSRFSASDFHHALELLETKHQPEGSDNTENLSSDSDEEIDLTEPKNTKRNKKFSLSDFKRAMDTLDVSLVTKDSSIAEPEQGSRRTSQLVHTATMLAITEEASKDTAPSQVSSTTLDPEDKNSSVGPSSRKSKKISTSFSNQLLLRKQSTSPLITNINFSSKSLSKSLEQPTHCRYSLATTKGSNLSRKSFVRKRYTLIDLQHAMNDVRSPSFRGDTSIDARTSSRSISSFTAGKFSIRDIERAVTTLKAETADEDDEEETENQSFSSFSKSKESFLKKKSINIDNTVVQKDLQENVPISSSDKQNKNIDVSSHTKSLLSPSKQSPLTKTFSPAVTIMLQSSDKNASVDISVLSDATLSELGDISKETIPEETKTSRKTRSKSTKQFSLQDFQLAMGTSPSPSSSEKLGQGDNIMDTSTASSLLLASHQSKKKIKKTVSLQDFQLVMQEVRSPSILQPAAAAEVEIVPETSSESSESSPEKINDNIDNLSEESAESEKLSDPVEQNNINTFLHKIQDFQETDKDIKFVDLGSDSDENEKLQSLNKSLGTNAKKVYNSETLIISPEVNRQSARKPELVGDASAIITPFDEKASPARNSTHLSEVASIQITSSEQYKTLEPTPAASADTIPSDDDANREEGLDFVVQASKTKDGESDAEMEQQEDEPSDSLSDSTSDEEMGEEEEEQEDEVDSPSQQPSSSEEEVEQEVVSPSIQPLSSEKEEKVIADGTGPSKSSSSEEGEMETEKNDEVEDNVSDASTVPGDTEKTPTTSGKNDNDSNNSTPANLNFSGILSSNSSSGSEKLEFASGQQAGSARRDLSNAFFKTKDSPQLKQNDQDRADATNDVSGISALERNPTLLDAIKNYDLLVEGCKKTTANYKSFKQRANKNYAVTVKKTIKNQPQVPPEKIIDGKVYRKPRLSKPKPWVTKRLYDLLEKHFSKKNALQARRLSEDFAEKLAEKVTGVIRCKTHTEKSVKTIAELLKKEGFVEDNYSFFCFSMDYLPSAFIPKAFPYNDGKSVNYLNS